MFRMASYYNAKSHLEKRYFKEDLECLSKRLNQIKNRKNPFYKCLLNKTELPKNNFHHSFYIYMNSLTKSRNIFINWKTSISSQVL